MKFKLENEGLEAFNKWNNKHVKICPVINNGKPYPSDATGFRLTFSFSPTGVGNIIKASCACGASKDCYDPYSIENF